MPEPIRVAIVGLGHIGMIHVRALGQMAEFELVAACDHLATHANRLEGHAPRGRPAAVFFDSHADLLADANVDTVIVATPSGTHFRIAQDCLAARRNVIVEKPACRTMRELEALEATAAEHGRHVYYSLHAAFGKEVTWTAAYVRDHVRDRLPVTGFDSVFTDRYLDGDGGIAPQAVGLDDCWTDSAINALSILDRFVPLETIRPARVAEARHGGSAGTCIDMRTVYAGSTDHAPCSVHTRWDTGPSRKTTTLYLGSRNRRIVMDHMRQTVAESDEAGTGSRLLAAFTGDRLLQHYEGVLRDYLRCRSLGTTNHTLARRVHHQAFAAEELRK